MSIRQKETLASERGDAVASSPALRKELNLFDAVAIVVGTIIGSGIFLIPSSIAARLDSLGAVLLVWVVGGFLTLCGALSLAELGSIFPGTGGLCTYLRHTYGPLPAFLYAYIGDTLAFSSAGLRIADSLSKEDYSDV
jgi:amino acid transporter